MTEQKEADVAKIGEDAPPAPAPAPEPVTVVDPVDDYPERPYSEAITDEHRETLRKAGIEV